MQPLWDGDPSTPHPPAVTWRPRSSLRLQPLILQRSDPSPQGRLTDHGENLQRPQIPPGPIRRQGCARASGTARRNTELSLRSRCADETRVFVSWGAQGGGPLGASLEPGVWILVSTHPSLSSTGSRGVASPLLSYRPTSGCASGAAKRSSKPGPRGTGRLAF